MLCFGMPCNTGKLYDLHKPALYPLLFIPQLLCLCNNSSILDLLSLLFHEIITPTHPRKKLYSFKRKCSTSRTSVNIVEWDVKCNDDMSIFFLSLFFLWKNTESYHQLCCFSSWVARCTYMWIYQFSSVFS